jgi:hypothetical protein
MKLQVLLNHEAFKAGAELWIVPGFEYCHLTRQIDWYLNFQLGRGLPHRPPPLSKELTDVARKWDFDPPEFKIDPQAPLMIASRDLLPNDKTILIPYEEPVKTWAQAIYKIWVDLQKPSLRVFLPDGVPPASFEASWPEKADETITLVGES